MQFIQTQRYKALAVSGALATAFMCGIPDAGAQNSDDPATQAATQADIQELLNRGRAALEANRWKAAEEAFAEVLNKAPSNREALDGLRQAQAMLNQAGTIDDVGDDISVQSDKARVEFNESYRNAQSLLSQGDLDAANRTMLVAQIRLNERRSILGNEYNAMNARAEQLLDDIERAREARRLEEEREAAADAQRDKEAEARAEESKRQQQIIENLRRIRQLQMEQKYEEALQVVDQILFIDEHNPAGLILRDALNTALIATNVQREYKIREHNIAGLTVGNVKATIAPVRNLTGPGDKSLSGIMTYPEDWPRLSLGRTDNRYTSGYREPVVNRQTEQQLASTSVPVDFSDVTFENAVSYLEQVTGSEFYVDWKALDLIGIDRDDEITLQLNQVDGISALDRILEQFGDDLDRPKWTIQEGIVTVSSDEALRRDTMLVVYDIRDLLFQVPMFDNAPELDIESALNQGRPAGRLRRRRRRRRWWRRLWRRRRRWWRRRRCRWRWRSLRQPR
jgi:tetratricopeptide (TPR) repeat protein